jgi:hypothetical protein
MTLNWLTALRLRLFRNGYTPLPVVGPNTPGKSPGKRPGIGEWQSVEVNEASIREWEKTRRGCVNTGLRCGILRAVDIDVHDADLAKALQDRAAAVLGPTPLLRVGKAPKLLLCYRVVDPRPKAETLVYLLPDQSLAQIEILGLGQQMVAFGTHPDTKAEYTWPASGPDIVPLLDLPIIDATAEAEFLIDATAMIIEAHGVEPPKEETEKKFERARSHSSQESDNAKPDLGTNFFRSVNSAALHGLDRWVKRLFPAAQWQDNATTPPGAWRVSSADLGRGLEEDISIHPVEGAQDFGTRQSKSPIDLLIEHGGAPDATAAALTLCEWLGIDPASIGWRGQTDKATRPRPGRRSDERPAEDWQDPIDFLSDDEVTGAPVLSVDHVPLPIFQLAQDLGTRMGVDPAAVALIALATCASAVTDDWSIQPKRRDTTWTENPRLWAAIVGSPSILKSPIIAACTRPIDELEIKARERYSAAVFRWKVDHKAWKDAGSDPSTEPRPPRLERYMVEGTTMEALSEALRDDMEAKQRAPAGKILVRQDEMSEWLASFDRYRSGGSGGADRGAYLRLYNGGRYTVDRISRGAFAIPNWSACFVGGIQPGPIQRVAQGAAEDGLLQRFCFCVPSHQAAGEDQAPDYAAKQAYEAIVAALTALRPAVPLVGSGQRPVVLHAAAHVHREATVELARALAAMPDTSERLKAAYGKWPGLWARIALTFHLILHAHARATSTGTLPIEVLPEATARMASAYIEQILLPHLQRADALMYRTKQAGHARWIACFILSRELNRITVRDVVQAYGALRQPEDRRELQSVMEGLIAMGWLRAEERDDLTRPITAWQVNPKVLELFAARGLAERSRRRQAQEEVADLIRRQRRPAA